MQLAYKSVETRTTANEDVGCHERCRDVCWAKVVMVSSCACVCVCENEGWGLRDEGMHEKMAKKNL